ncbi:MAG TPA: hypothetical protein VEO55_10770, partial [Candidatus Dormibacteraeota bacterium]|nr:hypothetical protein [Candidatus Dormibacteraeota bacterium]
MNIARLLVFSLIASLAVCGNTAALEANPASSFDNRTVQLKILSPNGKRTIGSTRFTVTADNSSEVIKGETTYTDGEHDAESERVYVGNADSTPRLETYEHSFFNADGTLQMVDMLDAKSGIASCTSYSAGKISASKSQLEVPADSFAGGSELMMVVG